MDEKLKHLDFIQNAINRLSSNSFTLKGWSVTLVSALFALSANNTSVFFVYLAYIPAIAFWGLDGYFLSQERKYRKLYDDVCNTSPEEINFSMNTSKYNENKNMHWFSSMLSKTLVLFHSTLIGAIIIIMFIQI